MAVRSGSRSPLAPSLSRPALSLSTGASGHGPRHFVFSVVSAFTRAFG